ncbi:TBC1 domain family member 15-like, partial [Trifolium medium]|nr:TBC1 domain family member 15-like [Trifolium medium]
GSASVMLCNDSTKQSSSSSELQDAEIIYSKDNVAIHPTQFAISGRLKLIKQGPALFMTWIPYKGHNADNGLSDKGSLHLEL